MYTPNHRLSGVTPFAPVIALAVAFIVLLRVLIWQRRRDEKRRAQRRER
ncbi:hypothetical protein GCM10022286_07260 [Gryllotalpicola daejeonensis]|uniref:LPXTG cell wall anchor domain-containing protein n=1 Tax=Gryllotalpicola daejeonensis TaxID=993087 RepID=A0ABP7ZG07_9MICO